MINNLSVVDPDIAALTVATPESTGAVIVTLVPPALVPPLSCQFDKSVDHEYIAVTPATGLELTGCWKLAEAPSDETLLIAALFELGSVPI